MLQWMVYGLGAAIGLMLLGVLVRETWRVRERRHFVRLSTVCTEELEALKDLEAEELGAQLQASFPLPVIEMCLEQLAEQSAKPLRQKLLQVHQDLGIVQARIDTLSSAGSWPERAAAAERLGHIGHSEAVLPLIAVLKDQSED
jgi:HEAT repeat protein